MGLAREGGTIIANGQAQGPEVPEHAQVDIGSGAHRRARHELADHQARERNNPPQPPVQQRAGDEVPGGVGAVGWALRCSAEAAMLGVATTSDIAENNDAVRFR